jgi:CubicO group peptidase (beta-lactamase class C family)
MGARQDAYITVDGLGAARSAGGICCHIEDLARFGEMVRQGGVANGRRIVPQAWIEDIRNNGSVDAWAKGDMLNFTLNCAYRSQWYNLQDETQALLAIGIHGQWIYIDHQAEITIVKQSSQPLPVDEALDRQHLAVFAALAQSS